MERVKTILTHPYPHEHSRHAVIAVVVGCLFFISSDNIHTLVQKLDSNIKWWSMYGCLLGFFYFFSSPFLGKTIKPSYSNFSRWYIGWILVAALYHLPSFQSMGVDLRMNLSLFLNIYVTSILFLLVFHLVFLGLWYLGLVARVAGSRPEVLTIVQNCAVLSMACCIFYSHCGNRALLKEKPHGKSYNWFPFWKKQEPKAWIAKLLRINEMKDEICSSWFAPVGSASDYPLLSKWVIYGELACNGSCDGSSEGISPIYSLWATFIGLYIANYVVERSTGWALTHPVPEKEFEKLKKKQMGPEFLDMVPWYSGTSADLFKTVFDLLVSVTVFVGRFDMRMMQAAMSSVNGGAKEDDLLFDHFTEKDEFWFDFLADTGDGGNSSYTVARLVAQPCLRVWSDNKMLTLPRANLLLIGGDLAYPNPSSFTYEKRFFRPFEYALQPPPWFKKDHVAINKPELPSEYPDIKLYDGPQCFLIPGNHDWFDGLQTFMRYICHKSWLGGWLMPQKKSYFALQLPKGWWIFGLDLALHMDIDVYQFKFFSELIMEKVGDDDSVIIVTHEPIWLLDWYWSETSAKNVLHLVRDCLKGRCKIWIAGDLHNYLRHSHVPTDTKPTFVQHLIVNGCGGAFLHPTHVFSNFNEFDGAAFETKSAYPSFEDSSRIALGNILKFRKKNWQFDIIGGVIYFILAFSMFPQCNLDHILQKDTFSDQLGSFFTTVWDTFLYLLGYSYVSAGGAAMLLIIAITFVPPKVSRKRQALIGILHVSAHLSAALILMLLLELGIETCIQHKLLATSGYHTLYEWYRTMENEHFPDPSGLRARIEQWTYGLYPACIKYLMSAFDIPEVMAVTRNNICKNGMDSLSRGGAVIYYAAVFLYFWVFTTPVVSLVFGSYLYICINWLNLHFDEAFSSLRIANYKAVTRFHINSIGDLEVFTLAVDKVPKEWKLDYKWDGESRQPNQLSHHIKWPSKWCAISPQLDPINTVKIVDHFVVQRTSRQNGLEENGH
ncbi:uncharacterized protein LOC124912574 [Impatiens glandulifera]|uniref:uncharacterized protein LOC124912574 n=1 Tax=Impatiens glandulifera TaxID=253017 RepID=UPI001FB0F553|nr:uncharacterized protein LOC124912574 [Impatiens glandulifera]